VTIEDRNFYAVSPDNNRFVVVTAEDGTWDVLILNFETGDVRLRLNADSLLVGVMFSPDGNLIAAHFASDQILIWDLETGNLVGSFVTYTRGVGPNSVFGVAFSPDGSKLLIGENYQDGRLVLWDWQANLTTTLVEHLSDHMIFPKGTVAFSPICV
jgi:WD40 repeat protein